jgi:hypothetical protein
MRMEKRGRYTPENVVRASLENFKRFIKQFRAISELLIILRRFFYIYRLELFFE